MPGIGKGPYAGMLLEGVVVDYFPVGHPKNRSGIEDEYEVEIASSVNELTKRNCRLAQPVGYNNGFQAPLRPKTARVDGGASPRGVRYVRGTLTDGDTVLVQFIDGLQDRPIITHVISNANSRWRRKLDDYQGPFIERRHAGTTVLFDHLGNVVVNIGTDEDGTKAADKSYTLKADGTQIVKATQDRVDVFDGGKAVALKDGAVSATAAMATWMGNVNTALGGAAPVPTSFGTITSGSDKLFSD